MTAKITDVKGQRFIHLTKTTMASALHRRYGRSYWSIGHG